MQKSKGFTLIEVLVVAGIIIVLTMILVSNFPRIKLLFALSRSTYKFGQDLRRMQALGFADAPYRDSSGSPFPTHGYGIYIRMMENKKYTLFADSVNGVVTVYDSSLDYTLESVDLEPGVMIKSISNPLWPDVNINFIPPNTITIGNSLMETLNTVDTLDIVFALESDQATTKTVSINTAGLIEVER